jgi:hypothetical protein
MIRGISPSRSYASDGSGPSGLVQISGEGAPRRTLDDIREQVAHEIAVRAITKAKVEDGEESPPPVSPFNPLMNVRCSNWRVLYYL